MKYDNVSLMQKGQKLPSFHDWLWKDLKFDYALKQALLRLSSEDESLIAKMVFDGVISFTMNCCNFWGKSPHIDCISVMEGERRAIVKQVFSQKQCFDYGMSCLKSEDAYLEVAVSGISGDLLTIVCESITCDF